MAKRPKILALDLDGTLCEYDGWKGADHFGKPHKELVDQLYELKKRGDWAIVIFTTRATNEALRKHLDAYDVPYDFINKHPWQPPGSSHKPTADVYLDDRALRYEGDPTDLADKIVEASTPWYSQKKMGHVANALVDVLADEDDSSFVHRNAMAAEVLRGEGDR